jgi:DNA-binding NarL/FixJ family response regulator
VKVVLIGNDEERAQLRARLPSGVDVSGEVASLRDARSSAYEADAWIVRPQRPLTVEIEPAPESLTRRELEVLQLVADGLSNKAIAERLGISDQTAKFHVASICAKLGAANRTQAVRRALRRGLIAI